MYWFAIWECSSYFDDPQAFLNSIQIYKGNKDDLLDFAWCMALNDTNVSHYYKSKRLLLIEIYHIFDRDFSEKDLFFKIGKDWVKEINSQLTTYDLRGDSY